MGSFSLFLATTCDAQSMPIQLFYFFERCFQFFAQLFYTGIDFASLFLTLLLLLVIREMVCKRKENSMNKNIELSLLERLLFFRKFCNVGVLTSWN